MKIREDHNFFNRYSDQLSQKVKSVEEETKAREQALQKKHELISKLRSKARDLTREIMKSRKKNLMYLQSYTKILKENTQDELKRLNERLPAGAAGTVAKKDFINSFSYGEKNRAKPNSRTRNKDTWSFNVNLSNASKALARDQKGIKKSAMVFPKPKKLLKSNEANLVKFHSQEYPVDKGLGRLRKLPEPSFNVCETTSTSNPVKKVSFLLKDTIEESEKENEDSNFVNSKVLARSPKGQIRRLLLTAKADLERLVQNKKRQSQSSVRQIRDREHQERQKQRDRQICRRGVIGEIYYNALIKTNKKFMKSVLFTKSGFQPVRGRSVIPRKEPLEGQKRSRHQAEQEGGQ